MTISTAAALIARSISHTEIASATWSTELAAALDIECDDGVDASNTVTEYWGVTLDGDEWRVHLTGARSVEVAS